MKYMKAIVAYLILVIIGIAAIWSALLRDQLPNWISEHSLLIQCVLVGGIGGVTYCLRAIYLSACVQKNWDSEWLPWYIIRPMVSLITGGVSWLFLKAGLLVLDSVKTIESNNLGFIALAFIAGYNVDKFLRKLEQISESTWGIEKSRGSNDTKRNDK